jgi:hypothetical protein
MCDELLAVAKNAALGAVGITLKPPQQSHCSLLFFLLLMKTISFSFPT